MNEETKQPETEEVKDDLEASATEPPVEDVQPEESLAESEVPVVEDSLPDEPLPDQPLPDESDEPFDTVELPDDEITDEDEFPSELDLGEDELDFETESAMVLIIAGDPVTDEGDEHAIETDANAATESLAQDETSFSDESLTTGDDEQATETDANAVTTAEITTEAVAVTASESEVVEEQITATREELKPAIESLLFVADEPLPFKHLCKVMGDVPEEDVLAALRELGDDYEARSSGLEVREIAGGWRISTRPQNHEFIRKYLKSRPSARLSLPALETLAVIAYKQPITIPEILEIRGVSSSSAIKTLLEKRLIVTKGRKETVGKPMLYGTSKEFLIQFGLKDLNELPSIEDFEDLSQ